MKLNFTYTDELYHFGVKGMKWGVRRDRTSPGKVRGKRRRMSPEQIAKLKRASGEIMDDLGAAALGYGTYKLAAKRGLFGSKGSAAAGVVATLGARKALKKVRERRNREGQNNHPLGQDLYSKTLNAERKAELRNSEKQFENQQKNKLGNKVYKDKYPYGVRAVIRGDGVRVYIPKTWEESLKDKRHKVYGYSKKDLE